MYSWWWVELSPETCRVKPLRRIHTIVASCWIYFTIKHDARNHKYYIHKVVFGLWVDILLICVYLCSMSWQFVLWWVIPSITQDCVAFTFRVKQYKKRSNEGTIIFQNTGKDSPDDTAPHSVWRLVTRTEHLWRTTCCMLQVARPVSFSSTVTCKLVFCELTTKDALPE